MQYKKIYLALVFLSVSVIPAYSQTAKTCDATNVLICVGVAEGFYEEGDTVVISGKVKAVILDSPVSLQIFYGDALIQIDQLSVAQDGTFATTIISKGPMWTKDGTYLVRAAYSGNIAEASFEFKAKDTGVTTNDMFEVDAGNFGTFDVPYTINGGNVTDIQIDPNILGLVVTIKSERDGILTLDLPRDYIDAKKSDGTDEKYIILIGDSETSYEETSDRKSRSIKINFEKGDTTIDIIGTVVVPEFGSYIILALTISFLTLLLIQQRNKFLVKDRILF